MNHRSDHRRRQRNLPLRSQVMKEFDQRVRDVIQTEVNTDLTPTDPVILHSRPGCQPQAAHCDYVPDEALKRVGVGQMPACRYHLFDAKHTSKNLAQINTISNDTQL